MAKASGREGRGPEERTAAGPLFPSDGNFNTVVPLSHVGEEAVPSREAAESARDESDEATLVPARVRRASHSAPPPPVKGIEQSRALLGVVIILSVAAGVVAGAFMVRSQRTLSTAGDAPAAEVAGTVPEPESAAETSVPQTTSPAPPPDATRLAAEPRTATHSETTDAAETKVEGAEAPALPSKAVTSAAETSARRAAETEPRAERRVRAAAGTRAASPAPRPTRAGAPPRPAASATDGRAQAAGGPAERSLPISSPPPSARPKKVIQWP